MKIPKHEIPAHIECYEMALKDEGVEVIASTSILENPNCSVVKIGKDGWSQEIKPCLFYAEDSLNRKHVLYPDGAVECLTSSEAL